MNSKLIFSATLAMGLMMASCSKDNGTVTPAGPENTGINFGLRAVNGSTGIHQRTTAGGILHWTSGYANPTEVKFEAKSKDTKIEYKSKNDTRIDLFAPVAPHFGYFMLPAGTYKEIELKLKLDNAGPEPALYLAGTYSDQGLVIPVVFRVDDNIEIKTELKDVTIDNTTSIAAITDLDLSSYMSGVTESMLRNAQLTNGTLVISEDSNRSLYNLILKNLTGKRHKCEFKKHK